LETTDLDDEPIAVAGHRVRLLPGVARLGVGQRRLRHERAEPELLGLPVEERNLLVGDGERRCKMVRVIGASLRGNPTGSLLRGARVVEWQTRRTQNPLPARACGFESHLGHAPPAVPSERHQYPGPVVVTGIDTVVWVSALVVLAIVALLLILIAPWKSVRDEPAIPTDIETRLLLGEDPSKVAADADAAEARRAPVVDLDANRPDEDG
jgi:hypothetical protein